MPSFSAISSSVGARCSFVSSSAIARSIWRARVRTERGTQSSERSSSMIAPLMRAIAYVSNLIVAVGVEALDRADQPEQPVRDEVLLVDVRRQAAPKPPGDELHERRVGEDQAVAERLVLGLPVLLPERLGLVGRSHGKRIRRACADSSDPPAHERATSEIAHPHRERRGGERDDPRTPTGERRVDRDEPQADGERGEEDSEEVALHAQNGATPCRGTIPPQLRGVAQLAERWSPKPEVAGSIPVAPAGSTRRNPASGRALRLVGRSRELPLKTA